MDQFGQRQRIHKIDHSQHQHQIHRMDHSKHQYKLSRLDQLNLHNTPIRSVKTGQQNGPTFDARSIKWTNQINGDLSAGWINHCIDVKSAKWTKQIIRLVERIHPRSDERTHKRANWQYYSRCTAAWWWWGVTLYWSHTVSLRWPTSGPKWRTASGTASNMVIWQYGNMDISGVVIGYH